MAGESLLDHLDLLKQNWPEAWQKTDPEVILFLKIGEQLQQSIAYAARKSKVLEVDFKVLFRLRGNGRDNPQSPTSLFTYIGITSGGLTKALHRLQKEGYVERVPNPDDGRSTLVKITAKGMELAENIFYRVLEHDKQYLSVLNEDEKKTIRRLCEKLVDGNKRKD